MIHYAQENAHVTRVAETCNALIAAGWTVFAVLPLGTVTTRDVTVLMFRDEPSAEPKASS